MKKTILFIVVLSLISCKKLIYEESKIYDLSQPEIIEAYKYFSKLELTPLKFDKETYPSAVWQLDIMDEYVIIKDKSQFLHIFDPDGNYISSSNMVRGQGPDEYSILNGHYIHAENHSIEVLDPTRKLTYDINFNFIDGCRIPTQIGKEGRMFESGYIISDSLCLLLPSGISATPYIIYVYDTHKEEIIREIEYSEDIIAPISMQEHNFFKMDDGSLLFSPSAYTGNIYRVIPEIGEMTKYIILKYAHDTLTKTDVEKYVGDPDNILSKLLMEEKSIPISTMLNNRYIVSVIKKGKQYSGLYTIITGIKDGKSYRINTYDGKRYHFPKIMNIDDNYIYCVTTKEFLLDNKDITQGFCIETDSCLKNIDLEDFVLLKYTLPNNDER